MLNRRGFLKTIGALVLLPFVKREAKAEFDPRAFIDPGLTDDDQFWDEDLPDYHGDVSIVRWAEGPGKTVEEMVVDDLKSGEMFVRDGKICFKIPKETRRLLI